MAGNNEADIAVDAVCVTWVDSSMSDGWHPYEEAREGAVLKCYSFGVLINETDDQLVVAPHVGFSPLQACGVMNIPKKCILTVHKLRKSGSYARNT